MSGADRCDEIVRIIDEALADVEAHRPARVFGPASKTGPVAVHEEAADLN